MWRPWVRFKSFLTVETGAVAVDWTVLGAATVGLGLSAVVGVRTGVLNLGTDINASLSNASLAVLGSLGEGSFVFSALYYTQKQIDAYLAMYNTDSYTIDNMAYSYSFYSKRAADLMASGDYNAARIAIDAVYVYEQTLIAKGGALPDGFAPHQELYERYEARPA